MNEFEQQYQVARHVWTDCQLGYLFTPNLAGTRTKQAVVAQLSEAHVPMPTTGPVQVSLLNSSLYEISSDDGRRRIAQLLTQAAHYSSNETIPNGEADELAAAFVSTFDEPLVFANSLPGGGWHQVTGHTIDSIVCCIDPVLTGCLLAVENE